MYIAAHNKQIWNFILLRMYPVPERKRWVTTPSVAVAESVGTPSVQSEEGADEVQPTEPSYRGEIEFPSPEKNEPTGCDDLLLLSVSKAEQKTGVHMSDN
ncbi:hypothetical protein ANCCAN_07720 [Ancylostoma caninum]|uniref:Uncharacterized protein n=1 Tax=Ancylostoma caninum TaxID=29170 RepID=A0A368GT86_ANCCA|nr:hypothetical protein ANCCAN_07720 [Ancylostoma caninum]